MHIGLIGGIGPAATEFYYRGLIDRYAKSNATLELTIAHADVREMARNLANGDAKRQADVFAALLRRLAAAGASWPSSARWEAISVSANLKPSRRYRS